MLLSNNGMYIVTNDVIYSIAEQKTYQNSDIDVFKLIDILKENTIFSIKNNLVEVRELSSYIRKTTYQLFESFNNDSKSKLILEYESKFGNRLLLEHSILIENWFGDAWDWTKDKVSSMGNWIITKGKELGSAGWKMAKDLISCIHGDGCSPFFSDYREALYSPAGIAIETFLSATGLLSPLPTVVWGVMLLWDTYLLISGSSEASWGDFFLDILGAGALGVIAKGARGVLGRTVGKGLGEVVADGMKNPQTASIVNKTVGIVSSGLTSIMKPIQAAGRFLSQKLGFKWVGEAIDGVSKLVSKMLETVGVVAKKGTTQAGVKSAIKNGGVAQAFTSGANMLKGNGEKELLNKLSTGTAEYVDGIDY